MLFVMLISLVQELYLELTSEPEAATWIRTRCKDSPASRSFQGSPRTSLQPGYPKPVCPVAPKSIHYPNVQYQVKPLCTPSECNKPSAPLEPREQQSRFINMVVVKPINVYQNVKNFKIKIDDPLKKNICCFFIKNSKTCKISPFLF